MDKKELDIRGNKFLFGEAANHDLIQDALIIEKGDQTYNEEDVDPLLWIKKKLELFVKNEDTGILHWTYKGSRDLLEIGIYSGINNYLRNSKQPKINLDQAKELLYDFSFEERGQITSTFILSLIDKVSQNGQGEEKAQQPAVS